MATRENFVFSKNWSTKKGIIKIDIFQFLEYFAFVVEQIPGDSILEFKKHEILSNLKASRNLLEEKGADLTRLTKNVSFFEMTKEVHGCEIDEKRIAFLKIPFNEDSTQKEKEAIYYVIKDMFLCEVGLDDLFKKVFKEFYCLKNSLRLKPIFLSEKYMEI